MRKTFVVADNVISSLGFSTAKNFQNLICGNSGIKIGDYPHLYPEKFPASLVDKNLLNEKAGNLHLQESHTIFEQLLILSISDAIKDLSLDIKSPDTLIILASTKGNVDLLKNNPKGFKADRVHLWRSAQIVGDYFGTAQTPLIISNACISGVMALIAAQRFIAQGKYKYMIVAGCDVLSEFIVSGFQSFMSLSKDICRPFDNKRSGLSLGEGAATIVLSSQEELAKTPNLQIIAGAGSNDANHISGPSRTGEGLFIAINEVLNGNPDVDFISAHGTATPYNDDMESIALKRLGLENIPVNSFKGFIGHTMGAAGIIESIYCFETMRHNLLIKSAGFENPGTSEKINVVKQTQAGNVNCVLKTASGFGGSNAAILFTKNDK